MKKLLLRPLLDGGKVKRLTYCFCLAGLIAYMLLIHFDSAQNYGIESAIIESIIVALIANICYSSRWMIETWINYYFKNIYFPEGLRLSLFVLGLLFTFGLAWAEYMIVLS